MAFGCDQILLRGEKSNEQIVDVRRAGDAFPLIHNGWDTRWPDRNLQNKCGRNKQPIGLKHRL